MDMGGLLNNVRWGSALNHRRLVVSVFATGSGRFGYPRACLAKGGLPEVIPLYVIQLLAFRQQYPVWW